MVGLLHNFFKIFDKFHLIKELDVGSNFAKAGTIAYDLSKYGNQIDDVNASTKDKIVSGLHKVTAPLKIIPGISNIATVADKVIDSASYITDVLEGRKDAQPLPADIHNRDNPIGTLPNKIINSNAFKNYFGNFGRF
jgi:hypothetical protein